MKLLLSHPLALEALTWSSAIHDPSSLSTQQWSETRDVLRARSVLLEDGIDLWYGSGDAAYVIENKTETWLPSDVSILGCCAILLLKNP